MNSVSGVHGIMYGPKIKNGQMTNEQSIVYLVEKKLPLNQIPANEIIPSKINIQNNEYSTDVVQSPKFELVQCYNFDDPKVQYLQSYNRPLQGGMSISNLDSWTQLSPSRFSYSVGTLGFLAIDNYDDTLVGVTNNHVIIKDAFLNSEKNSLGISNSIIDPIVFSSSQGGLNATFNPTVLQFDELGNKPVNFVTDSIGFAKRYVPISENGYNSVDGALISINQGNTDFSSAQQAELYNSYAMPFATTNEILSLQPDNIQLYSVGRTTGPKGPDCPLVAYNIGSFIVSYNRQGVKVPIIMSDIIAYHFIDLSELPIFSGDSGSALIGNFSGTYKIVGLAFAGNTSTDAYNNPHSTFGLACRIDNVAQQLNISSWDGSPIAFTQSNQLSKIYRPYNDNRITIEYNGKTYYQAGTVKTNQDITNI